MLLQGNIKQFIQPILGQKKSDLIPKYIKADELSSGEPLTIYIKDSDGKFVPASSKGIKLHPDSASGDYSKKIKLNELPTR